MAEGSSVRYIPPIFPWDHPRFKADPFNSLKPPDRIPGQTKHNPGARFEVPKSFEETGVLAKQNRTRGSQPTPTKPESRESVGSQPRKAESRESAGSQPRKAESRESAGSQPRKAESRESVGSVGRQSAGSAGRRESAGSGRMRDRASAGRSNRSESRGSAASK
eukprot:CAMPEP_0175910968 /NCGR_PEP_ID=MMETSP0108-20121206/7947_1 /TAXON_ID=195067 ORGANISM="Goniomonas pacifica, Strain CCMP1869" /NCGR_SAMPLE_ID=MMETSP0108 /ASSEMBLY_ACC=CAM_ASM_000204 /LENGTH=163 /DNA_ID=CAMNT_0017233191 /DNA_START=28 /DNA_END=519 /DNA_ORIENTATION=+